MEIKIIEITEVEQLKTLGADKAIINEFKAMQSQDLEFYVRLDAKDNIVESNNEKKDAIKQLYV